MKNKNPKISIIMPTYNRAKVIDRAIKSIFNQTYKNWELIIIDDGSTDNTQEIIKPYLKNKKVSYFFQNNNGVSVARNYGLSLAKGDYITFLDSDDRYTKEHLEIRLRKMIDAKAKISLTNVFIEYPSKMIIKNKKGDRILNFIDLLESNAGALISLMAKKKLFKNIRFDKNLSVGEDFDFILRFPNFNKILFISDPLMIVEKNLSGDRLSTNLKKRIKSYKLIIKKMQNKKYTLSSLNKNIMYKKLNLEIGVSYALNNKYVLAKSFFKKAFKTKEKLKNEFRYRVIYFILLLPILFITIVYIFKKLWRLGIIKT